MIRTAVIHLFAGAALLGPLPAAAQEATSHGHAAPACASVGALPPSASGWGEPHGTRTAAAEPDAASTALLVPGQAVDAALLPTPRVRYAVAPQKPGSAVSFGGLFTVDVAEGGRYRVSLSTRGWIDVVEGKAALPSVAHAHGPACTTLAKMVDYDLKPGRHLLQVAASGEPAVSLMIAKLP